MVSVTHHTSTLVVVVAMGMKVAMVATRTVAVLHNVVTLTGPPQTHTHVTHTQTTTTTTTDITTTNNATTTVSNITTN